MRFRLQAAILTALAVVAGAADARGQLQSRQTSVELPSGARAGRLLLANTGDGPVAAQVRVYEWTQVNGEDQLDRSTGLVASPPIVEIPPGGEHLVRLVRPTAAPVLNEKAFRVVVDELPSDPRAGDGAAVRVRMRFLIPAFVRVSDPAPATLRCRLESATLTCENPGGRAAQLGASRLVDDAGHTVEITDGLFGYVLAGSVRKWSLDAAKLSTLGSHLKFEVSLNGQPATVDLEPAP